MSQAQADHRPGRVLNYYAIGQTIPPGAVYCGRPNPRKGLPDTGWGNPFAMRDPSDRDRVCDEHMAYMRKRLAAESGLADRMMRELDGKDKVCYCAPKRCHCDNYAILCGEIRAGQIPRF